MKRTLLVVMQGMMKENLVTLVIAELKKQPHIKELGGELSSNELIAFRQIMRKSIKDGEYIAQTEAADKQLKNDCQDEQTPIVVTDITNPILRDVAQENHYCDRIVILTLNDNDAKAYENSLRSLVAAAIKEEHILIFGNNIDALVDAYRIEEQKLNLV